MKPFIVAIDFDGTIVEDKYPNIGPLKENAVSCIKLLKELGCYIIVTSCRTSPNRTSSVTERSLQRQIMQKFLRENDIPYDWVDDGTQGKVVADIYVDDRAIRFENNWDEIVRIINLMLGE